MKRSTLLIILVGIIAGAVYGVVIAAMSIPRPERDLALLPEDPIKLIGAKVYPGRQARAVVVGSSEFNFGSLGPGGKGKHKFTIRNDGDAPLHLLEAGTSCDCTLSRLDAEIVAPGKSTTVELDWTTRGRDPEYRHTASIRTSDPDNPIINLSIAGRVTWSVVYEPESITFTNKLAGETATAEIEIFAFRKPQLIIESFDWENKETAERFDVTFTPLPSRLLKEKGATSGAKMVVSAKSGLPSGPIHQTIHLETNHKDVRRISIPITGRVISDELSLLAMPNPDIYDAKKNLLTLGGIPSGKGRVVRMSLIVRGRHAGKARLSVKSVRPEWLEVEIDKRKKAGTSAWLPLTITIPPDAPVQDFLGPGRDKMGLIVLETNHPNIPEIPVSIYFNIDPPGQDE